MISFGSIHAEEHPPHHDLVDEVESLTGFILNEYLPADNRFDPVKFVIEELCMEINPTIAHLNLLTRFSCLKPDELSPLQRKLYDQVAKICVKPKSSIKNARGHITEQMAKVAMEWLKHGKSRTNFYFFENGKKITGGRYFNDIGKECFHDEVDLVTDGRPGRPVYLGESKTAAGSFQKGISHIFDFYNYLAGLVKKSSGVETDVLFCFCQDVDSFFAELMSRVQPRNREIFSLELRNWKTGLVKHRIP